MCMQKNMYSEFLTKPIGLKSAILIIRPLLIFDVVLTLESD